MSVQKDDNQTYSLCSSRKNPYPPQLGRSLEIPRGRGDLQCNAPYRGHPTNFFLQVSQSGYVNLINSHASLQSPTGKRCSNKLYKTCCFVFYKQGGRTPDWVTCKKRLLGGYGKTRRTVKAKLLEAKCEAKLEFPEGNLGSKQKTFHGGSMVFFWNCTFPVQALKTAFPTCM